MISSLGHEVMTTPDHHSDTNAKPLVLGTFMKNTLLAFGPSKVESECAFSRCKTGILITLCYLNLFQHLPPPPLKKKKLGSATKNQYSFCVHTHITGYQKLIAASFCLLILSTLTSVCIFSIQFLTHSLMRC